MSKTTKYDLEFQPASRRRMQMVWRFVAGILSIALLLTVVSVIALQKDGLIDRLISTYIDPTEPTGPVDPDVWNYKGSAAFLLSGTDNARQALRFVFLVRVDAAKREVHITPFKPETKTPGESGEITLIQAQKEGGVKRLKTAVESLTETKIDRYITAADDEFMQALTVMGAVPVEIPARIDYRSAEFDITLGKGGQRLDGYWLLRYMRYLGTLKEGTTAQGELLGQILETYLVPANGESAEVLEKRFNTLVNILQTDVTAMEFQAQQLLLQALLQNSKEIKIKVQMLEGEAIH